MSDFEDAARALRKWAEGAGLPMQYVSVILSGTDSQLSTRIRQAAVCDLDELTTHQQLDLALNNEITVEGVRFEFVYAVRGEDEE